VQNQLNCIEHYLKNVCSSVLTPTKVRELTRAHASGAWLNSRRGINVHSTGWERKVHGKVQKSCEKHGGCDLTWNASMLFYFLGATFHHTFIIKKNSSSCLKVYIYKRTNCLMCKILVDLLEAILRIDIGDGQRKEPHDGFTKSTY